MQSRFDGEKIKFIKMQGLGNDFLVTDSRWCTQVLSPEAVKLWADRHLGVGFDQLLYLSPSTVAGVDLDYEIYNSDGSRVAQCGNGVRCAARYALETGLCQKDKMVLQTSRTLMHAHVLSDGTVCVSMGVPDFSPESLPFTPAWPADDNELFSPDLPSNLRFGVVSMGNPHAVIPVARIQMHEVENIGRQLSEHPFFPERVNVGFVSAVSDTVLDLAVYERGAGVTQACGSGACAAVAIMRRLGRVKKDVSVRMAGGELKISWEGNLSGEPLYMTGPAEFVFEGSISVGQL